MAALKPRLLILDPFVRLHRIDENVSGEVAPLLAFLRELQRRHQLAVVVVHHARKGAGKARAGQALRGSSEFHAWGDSNLYLRRTGEQLTLAVEQRAAASTSGIAMRLRADGEVVALETIAEPASIEVSEPEPLPAVEERVEHILTAATGPMTVAEIRGLCRVRNATLQAALAALAAAGRVQRSAIGYAITAR